MPIILKALSCAAAALMSSNSQHSIQQRPPICRDDQLAYYRSLISKNSQLANHPAVQQWLGPYRADNRENILRRKRLRINLSENTGSLQNQYPKRALTGDYYSEMIQGVIQRWPLARFPLRVYIQSTASNSVAPSPSQIFETALTKWTGCTNNRLTFLIVGNPESADITVQFGAFGTVSEYGDTETKWLVDWAGNQLIKHASIKIGTTGRCGPITKPELLKICLHEIGHALGLKHSGYAGDIMYYMSNQSQIADLGPRDAATINRLYENN